MYAPHALLALLDERLDPVVFDVFLGVDAQLLAHFHFDRQSVRIPARFSFAQIAAHGAVAREQVFDRPGQAVAGVWHAVGRRRTFVEHESALVAIAPPLERLFVDFRLTPKAEDFFFQLRKLNVRWNRLKHGVCASRVTKTKEQFSNRATGRLRDSRQMQSQAEGMLGSNEVSPQRATVENSRIFNYNGMIQG